MGPGISGCFILRDIHYTRENFAARKEGCQPTQRAFWVPISELKAAGAAFLGADALSAACSFRCQARKASAHCLSLLSRY